MVRIPRAQTHRLIDRGLRVEGGGLRNGTDLMRLYVSRDLAVGITRQELRRDRTHFLLLHARTHTHTHTHTDTGTHLGKGTLFCRPTQARTRDCTHTLRTIIWDRFSISSICMSKGATIAALPVRTVPAAPPATSTEDDPRSDRGSLGTPEPGALALPTPPWRHFSRRDKKSLSYTFRSLRNRDSHMDGYTRESADSWQHDDAVMHVYPCETFRQFIFQHTSIYQPSAQPWIWHQESRPSVRLRTCLVAPWLCAKRKTDQVGWQGEKISPTLNGLFMERPSLSRSTH